VLKGQDCEHTFCKACLERRMTKKGTGEVGERVCACPHLRCGEDLVEDELIEADLAEAE
jgi:hypothetical protein